LFKRGSGKFQDFFEVPEDSALYTRQSRSAWF
jgi:hypothetical protein